ncbi:cyclic nucleotide-binding domain-containing protein [candidate division WOR-3 bacterium]|nr:cyclic nucleotide-binding domain-containing protein [candidate division WOR-3 bacterium]
MKDFLKKVFEGIGKEEIEKLEKIFKEVSFKKDQTIVKEDEYGEEIYILKKGHALVTKKGNVLAELKPGDIIGEMSLEGAVRSASVVAVDRVVLYKSDIKDFYKLLSEHPKIAICLFRTISSRLRKIDDKVVEKALQEERLAVLGRLGSTIIHDLKSPLSAIKGYANILEDIGGNDRVKKYAKSISSSADFTFDMIEDILEFGRDKSTVDFRPVNIYQYFKEVVDLFGERTDGKEIEIKILPCEGLYYELDPFKMKRVLLNLLKNAREAIEKKGEIEMGAEKTKDGIKIFVRDNGIGMPPEVVCRIFEPFFTHGKHGTGLGMTVVRKIIDNHKGEINIDSAPGKGTTFNILLKNNPDKIKDQGGK